MGVIVLIIGGVLIAKISILGAIIYTIVILGMSR